MLRDRSTAATSLRNRLQSFWSLRYLRTAYCGLSTTIAPGSGVESSRPRHAPKSVTRPSLRPPCLVPSPPTKCLTSETKNPGCHKPKMSRQGQLRISLAWVRPVGDVEITLPNSQGNQSFRSVAGKRSNGRAVYLGDPRLALLGRSPVGVEKSALTTPCPVAAGSVFSGKVQINDLAPKWNNVMNDGELIDDESRHEGDGARATASK